MKKFGFIILGSLSLTLGLVGIFFPVLPTTPFLLLASFLYLHSSEELYNWLIHHRFFGEYINNYLSYKAVRKSAKIATLIFLWVSLGLSIFLSGSIYIKIALFIIGVGVSIHVLTLKTLRNKKQLKQTDDD